MSREEIKLPKPALEMLPHRPPMLLIEELVECDGEYAMAKAGPWLENPFADETGALDPAVLIELMAQCYAAARGYRTTSSSEQPVGGFLVGVKDFTVHRGATLDDTLLVEVRETDVLGGFHIADAKVSCGNELIAEGVIRVWEDMGGEAPSRQYGEERR